MTSLKTGGYIGTYGHNFFYVFCHFFSGSLSARFQVTRISTWEPNCMCNCSNARNRFKPQPLG